MVLYCSLCKLAHSCILYYDNNYNGLLPTQYNSMKYCFIALLASFHRRHYYSPPTQPPKNCRCHHSYPATVSIEIYTILLLNIGTQNSYGFVYIFVL